MKTIKKIKESSKAVAGTALLVGATLAGGAAFSVAQSGSSGSGSTLGDYPAPYVDADDGTLDTTIVMGEDAKATDVVAAANIAGQLGNDAFSESEESVSVSGSFGWSAENGQSLDTQNDNLYFSQNINEVRQTLTEDQLDVLETQEVLTGDAEQEVEQYLYVGQQEVNFGTPGDTDGEEDPFLFVDNPSGTENDDLAGPDGYLYRLQANFQDGVEFNGNDGPNNNINEDVYGQEIAMFGMDFTVADASFTTGNEEQLILYGSSEQVSVDSGQSETVTIGGEEVTVEVVGVTGENTAAVRINGDLEQYSENDEETIAGEDLRVDNIIQTNADNSQGVVQFAIGSQQLTLEDGEPIMQGEDDEEVEGTQVVLSGTGVNSAAAAADDGDTVELSSVEVAVGADDSDNSYVRAGESFQDPVFDDVQFHFGGLNPDAGEGASDNVGEIEFSTDGDDTATVAVEDGDNSASIPFVYDSDLDDNTDGSEMLGSDADEAIHVQEGVAVQEDEYVTTDAGDFSHMWQVTSIDADSEAAGSIADGDEATVEVEDVVTGASVELDLDAYDPDGGDFTDGDDGNDYYRGEEVIDGQTYHVWTDTTGGGSVDDVYMTYGSGSDFEDTGDQTSVFTPIDTESGSAVGFYDEVTLDENSFAADDYGGDEAGDYVVTFEVPSTESTDSKSVTVAVDDSSTDDTDDQPADVDLELSHGGSSSATDYVQVGQLQYQVTVAADDTLTFGLQDNDDTTSGLQNDATTGGNEQVFPNPSAIVVQPEDDNDNEDAYVVTPGNDAGSDQQVDVGGSAGEIFYTGGYGTQTLESDDDMEVAYNMFGTHTMQDTEDQGSFTLHIPDGQSTAGAAFTGQEGSISASSSGSGSVTTMEPTGWADQSVALDSDNFVSNAKQNSNLILVGGPAANSLVQELVEANKTMATSEYTEGQGMLQQIDDAFTQGNDALVVAGYSGEDTRAAGDYLVDYEMHSDMLSGADQVEINTAEGSVVQ